MKAPEEATLPGGRVVATGLAVVAVDPAAVDPVVAGADNAVEGGAVVAEDGDADVDSAEDAVVDDDPVAFSPARCDEPDEQAVPVRATMTTSARSFTAAHLRAGHYTPLSTSAMSSPISDGLRPTRHPAFSSASILAAAVPLEPETMAPAWPIFLPGGAVTPAT